MPDASPATLDRESSGLGRSSTLLVVLVACVAAGVAASVFALLFRGADDVSSNAPTGDGIGGAGQALDDPGTPAEPASGTQVESRAQREDVAAAARPAICDLDASRFQGTARIEGYLILPRGVEPPQSWALVLAPSKVLIGGDRAVARRVEFEHGETTFTLTEVPLGGYELRAEAPRMSGATEYLLLARPEAQHAVVHLALSPAAFVSGRVVDAEGAAVAGLEVLLEPEGGGERRSATTGPSGAYLFELVPDGSYRLLAGDPHAPIAPARELLVGPPSLHMPDLVVPVLSVLQIRVVDRDSRPVPGARVEGWGSQGGRISAVTDERGLARASFLPAGRYSIRASAPAGAPPLGGHTRIELPRDGSEELVVVLE